MIYISVPVHESIPVINDQLKNFEKLFPGSIIVLHVSPTANFTKTQLHAELSAKNARNFYINPVSVPTQWGSIIQAHLANISLIKSFGDASRIVFHASNDLLVIAGAHPYIEKNGNIFNLRLIEPGSHWWISDIAANDFALRKTVASLGSTLIYGSQIEGSSYEADVIFEIADVIQKKETLDSEAFYPREEVIFPTLARALGVKSEGLPYVYSEVHYFDKTLWKYFDKYPKLFNSQKKFGRYCKYKFNKLMFKSQFYMISKADVDCIIRGDTSRLRNAPVLNDGNTEWTTYDPQHLYGVKRIERKLDDPIREHIRKAIK